MDNKPLKVSVFGSGSWATAIVKMLCENLEQVGWYMRSESSLNYIKENSHNPNYLSSVEFHTDQLELSNDINDLINRSEYLIFAIPSAFVYDELQKINVDISNKVVFSAIKGIIPQSGLLVGSHFHNHYNIPINNIGVITGPCHAEEVAMERLSYLTVACKSEETAKKMGELLQSHFIKTKTSSDLIGTEYAATLKNIYAIAAGIAHGLGYGDNFQAVLMSNAIREMKRFVKKEQKMKRNINQSAYLGDLLVTGYSVFSRNRMFGNMIGKGYTVKSAMMEMSMVAEGYYATKTCFDLNKTNKAKTPIIDAVYSILYKNKNAKEIFSDLTNSLD